MFEKIIRVYGTLQKNPFVYLFSAGLLILSCNQKEFSGTSTLQYRPGLHLKAGLKYYYTITNETETNLEVKGQKIENTNKLLVGVVYEKVKDTMGGFLLKITYDSITSNIKKGDIKKEMNAANGEGSLDPAERMLGILKGSSLLVSVNDSGKVVSINGYKEITDKLMALMNTNDEFIRNKMEMQYSGTMGDGFIKQNLEEGLGIFSDSAVHVGDSWKKMETNSTDMKLNVATTYTLVSLADSIAEINAYSEIKNSNTPIDISGVEVNSNLKGSINSNFKTDLKTGILLKSKTTFSVKGTISQMGMDIPVIIKSVKEVSTRKL